MYFIRSLIMVLALLIWGRAESLRDEWEHEIRPKLEYYCYDCHGDGMDKGGMNLDRFQTIEDMQAERGVWADIEKHLNLSLMPPLDEDQPKTEERQAISQWIAEAVFPLSTDHPGPSLIRRLNRQEYENTVNDLLGTRVSLKGILPQDDTGYGYDNISEVLTLSPTHLDKFFQTTEIALEDALSLTPSAPKTVSVTYESQRGGVGLNQHEHYVFAKSGLMSGRFDLESPGEYEIQVKAAGLTNSEGVPPLMELQLGNTSKRYYVTNGLSYAEDKWYKLRFSIPKAGPIEYAVALLNRDHTSVDEDGRGQLQIYDTKIAGPYPSTSTKPFAYRRLVGDPSKYDSTQAYYRHLLRRFLYRAFRRPVSEDEVQKYVTLASAIEQDGTGHSEALRSAYMAIMLSPQFLYREGAEVPLENGPGRAELVDEYTLASRLSYFLWSTMPDEELFRLAQEGELRENLSTQVERMLRDKRSEAFIENFVGQWLQLRDMTLLSYSREEFPEFEHRLQTYMQEETELLVQEILYRNRPLIELLTADYTYLNEPLARHYGIKNVKGQDFRRVTLDDPRRHGLLGHGSFQMLTSHPDRTSPVLRGKYVLENLLDLSPPPPPQDANQLTEAKILAHHTLRQQLEMHRQDPSCASCHNLMDPIGFGLERFNAIGQLRDQYEGGKPILTQGVLYRGEIFSDAVSLRQSLVENYGEDFYMSAIKNLLTYAVGRGMEWYDRGTVAQIQEQSMAQGGAFQALIQQVVASTPFQYRLTNQNDQPHD